jgi:dTDP-4-amino-4,6-dideoxygalactose transaminase
MRRMIPFNRPFRAPRELEYVSRALALPARQGNGEFTRRATEVLKQRLGAGTVALTQSCTAALELAALLSGVGPGDEVIMPSFTFVSTANAFVLRGATPVFVDVDPKTQNLDPAAVAAAMGPGTRAIVVVHYGGVGCDMDAFAKLASDAGLLLIEDAAQAVDAFWDDRPLGTFGDLAALSFHDSKNVSCGEGGALIVNRADLAHRAEILWEKGTNRVDFVNGVVDKYTWVDVGSSFLPSEITAAMLLAHLEAAPDILEKRRAVWAHYDRLLAREVADALPGTAVQICPQQAQHNGHLYYLVLPSRDDRERFMAGMREKGIATPFHYVPLHSSPAGQRYGRVHGPMGHTDRAGAGLVRLPLFADLEAADVDMIAQAALAVLRDIRAGKQ